MTRNEKSNSTKSGASRSRTNTNASSVSKKENLGCARKFSAVLTRFLFVLHSVLAIWRVTLEYTHFYIYFIFIGVAFMVLELVYTLAVRQGREYKWFCPSVFFYLITVVPCLWLLELSQLDKIYEHPEHIQACIEKADFKATTESPNELYISDLNATGVNESRNLTKRSVLLHEIILNERFAREIGRIGHGNSTKYYNKTTVAQPTVTARVETSTKAKEKILLTSRQQTAETISVAAIISTEDAKNKNIGDDIEDAFNDLGKNTVNLISNAGDEVNKIVQKLDFLGPERWLLALHQCLLFVLVIGRWLLPKGEITKDQLSQLLLVFIGVGADILEFVTETIENDELGEITCDHLLFYIIYGVWTWSLLQFTLVLTAAKSRKTRVGFESRITRISTNQGCCADTIFNNADLWGILATMFLQDAPFLATRIYIMVQYNHVHQMMLFFTIKNGIVVLLQIYRIIVIQLEHHSGKQSDDSTITQEEMQPLRSVLKRLARQATTDDGSEHGDIKTASVKRKKDGSMTVKVVLKDETKKS